jgi:hypothetical protein
MYQKNLAFLMLKAALIPRKFSPHLVIDLFGFVIFHFMLNPDPNPDPEQLPEQECMPVLIPLLIESTTLLVTQLTLFLESSLSASTTLRNIFLREAVVSGISLYPTCVGKTSLHQDVWINVKDIYYH